ncbi:MAG: hypothetical protein EOQ39_18940 [Mesorhizobium sp.]|uniref:hypothetical protein n=1 Tax=Mesorhizobium sp. TaxID=1871066 RepID=UPI000FE49E4C|nr:hypothetical protein [Mesorhizobium sp.]RWB08750.1 MAG: hypothetical protein EOQ37_04395 [Mesorhizobium sp.]RWB13598.1 MAG: hypothetical protein EOQ39_18940 [Mesorhizobium sp.]
MSIIAARDKLEELANRVPIEFGVEILTIVQQEMYRAKCVRRAPAASAPMSEALAKKIRWYAECNPDLRYQDIGQVFNVSVGRVSESLAQ